jgi:putative phage-type endonuclease
VGVTRRRTPTGVPVPGGDAAPGSEAWLAARLTGITATEIAELLGVSDYGTPLDVWARHTGRAAPVPVSQAMLLGSWMEDPIARFWADQQPGGRRLRRIPVLHHVDHRHHLASPDREMVDCPAHRTCGVEVKRRTGWASGRWSVTVPDDVTAQVAWQLHVTGWDAVHVVADIGSEVVEHVITRADVDDLIPDMIVAADAAWDDVINDRQPVCDPTAELLESLTRLFRVRDGDVVTDDTAVWDLAAELVSINAEAADVDRRAKEVRAALMQRLGGGKRLVVDGVQVCGFRETRSVEPAKILAAATDDNPDARDLFYDLSAAGFVGVTVSVPEVEKDDPELFARMDELGYVTRTPVWVGPKEKDIPVAAVAADTIEEDEHGE